MYRHVAYCMKCDKISEKRDASAIGIAISCACGKVNRSYGGMKI